MLFDRHGKGIRELFELKSMIMLLFGIGLTLRGDWYESFNEPGKILISLFYLTVLFGIAPIRVRLPKSAFWQIVIASMASSFIDSYLILLLLATLSVVDVKTGKEV